MKLNLNIDSWCALFADQISSSNNVFWLNSLDYQDHTFISPAFETIWGIHPEKLYQNSVRFSDFMDNDPNNQFKQYCVGRHNDHESGYVLYNIRSADGKQKLIRDRYMTLYNESGEPIAAAGVAIDISHNADLANDIKVLKSVDEQHQAIQNQYTNILSERLKLLSPPPTNALPILSNREKQCAHLLIQGKTAQQTANELFISKRTVERHLENIKIKFNCSRKVDLVKILVERNLADIKR